MSAGDRGARRCFLALSLSVAIVGCAAGAPVVLPQAAAATVPVAWPARADASKRTPHTRHGHKPDKKHKHKARPKPACDEHLKGSFAHSSRIIVYGVHARRSTTSYACVRPNGASVAIESDPDGNPEYGANSDTSGFKLAGDYVVDEHATGLQNFESCSMNATNGFDCESLVSYSVDITDALTRQGINQPLTGPPSPLAVSASGAAAWRVPQGTASASPPTDWTLQAIVVQPGSGGALAGTVATVDSGAIGATLTFDGLTLGWTNAGQAKRASLS